jgi:hypothetical protein
MSGNRRGDQAATILSLRKTQQRQFLGISNTKYPSAEGRLSKIVWMIENTVLTEDELYIADAESAMFSVRMNISEAQV